jgi:hypothetical protein
MFISSVQCTIVLVIINIVAIYGLWKLSEIACYQITQLSELFLDDFVSSYLRFSARLVQCMLWRHIIPPFDSMKQYQLIPHNSFSHYQHCHYSDLWPLNVKRDRILSNYAIVWKKYNFGPFGRIFIAIFLFESLSLTTVWSVYIFEIVSSNLYLLVLSRYIKISDFWPDCELITIIK